MGCGFTILPSIGTPAQAQWAVVTDGRVSYTNDAFQFSSARRARFGEDPSLPTVVPLDKPEDVIWEPAVEVVRASRGAWGTTELSANAHGFIYTNNPVFNHADYRVQAGHLSTQRLHERSSRRHPSESPG